MTRRCCVTGCCSRSNRPNLFNLSFHGFRKDIRQRWLEVLQKKEEDIDVNKSLVCSLHFTVYDYEDYHSAARILKKNAIPSINLNVTQLIRNNIGAAGEIDTFETDDSADSFNISLFLESDDSKGEQETKLLSSAPTTDERKRKLEENDEPPLKEPRIEKEFESINVSDESKFDTSMESEQTDELEKEDCNSEKTVTSSIDEVINPERQTLDAEMTDDSVVQNSENTDMISETTAQDEIDLNVTVSAIGSDTSSMMDALDCTKTTEMLKSEEELINEARSNYKTMTVSIAWDAALAQRAINFVAKMNIKDDADTNSTEVGKKSVEQSKKNILYANKWTETDTIGKTIYDYHKNYLGEKCKKGLWVQLCNTLKTKGIEKSESTLKFMYGNIIKRAKQLVSQDIDTPDWAIALASHRIQPKIDQEIVDKQVINLNYEIPKKYGLKEKNIIVDFAYNNSERWCSTNEAVKQDFLKNCVAKLNQNCCDSNTQELETVLLSLLKMGKEVISGYLRRGNNAIKKPANIYWKLTKLYKLTNEAMEVNMNKVRYGNYTLNEKLEILKFLNNHADIIRGNDSTKQHDTFVQCCVYLSKLGFHRNVKQVQTIIRIMKTELTDSISQNISYHSELDLLVAKLYNLRLPFQKSIDDDTDTVQEKTISKSPERNAEKAAWYTEQERLFILKYLKPHSQVVRCNNTNDELWKKCSEHLSQHGYYRTESEIQDILKKLVNDLNTKKNSKPEKYSKLETLTAEVYGINLKNEDQLKSLSPIEESNNSKQKKNTVKTYSVSQEKQQSQKKSVKSICTLNKPLIEINYPSIDTVENVSEFEKKLLGLNRNYMREVMDMEENLCSQKMQLLEMQLDSEKKVKQISLMECQLLQLQIESQKLENIKLLVN